MSKNFEALAAAMAAEVVRLDRTGRGSTEKRAEAWQRLIEHVWWGSKTPEENEAIAQKWVDAAASAR